MQRGLYNWMGMVPRLYGLTLTLIQPPPPPPLKTMGIRGWQSASCCEEMAAAAVKVTVTAKAKARLSRVVVASAVCTQREGTGSGTVVVVESTEATRDLGGTEGVTKAVKKTPSDTGFRALS